MVQIFLATFNSTYRDGGVLQRNGGMGSGTVGVGSDALLKTFQEVQLGLNDLQRKVNELVQAELFKMDVGMISGLGSTSGAAAGDVGYKVVGS